MKKFKSTLSLLLAVLMLVSLFPTSVFADAGATITVGSIDTAVDPGAAISIPVTIANNPGFASATFDIEYDEDVLEPVSVYNEATEENDILFVLGSDFKLIFSLVSGEAASLSKNNVSSNSTKNGEILTLNFKVKEDAAVNSTTVSLKLQGGLAKNFSDIGGNPVDVSFVSGTVAINGISTKRAVTFYNSDLTSVAATVNVDPGATLEYADIPTVTAPSGKVFAGYYTSVPAVYAAATQVTPGSKLNVYDAVTQNLSVYPVFVAEGNQVIIEKANGSITGCDTLFNAIDGRDRVTWGTFSPVAENGDIVRLVQDINVADYSNNNFAWNGELTFFDIRSLENIHIDLNGHSFNGTNTSAGTSNSWSSSQTVFSLGNANEEIIFENTCSIGAIDFNFPSATKVGSLIYANQNNEYKQNLSISFKNIVFGGGFRQVFDTNSSISFELNLTNTTCNTILVTNTWGGNPVPTINVGRNSKWKTEKGLYSDMSKVTIEAGYSAVAFDDGYTKVIDPANYVIVMKYDTDGQTLIQQKSLYLPAGAVLASDALDDAVTARASYLFDESTTRSFEFVGWALSEDATTAIDLTTVTGGKTLYPIYSYIDNSVTNVTCNGIGYATIAAAMKAAEALSGTVTIKLMTDLSEYVILTENTPDVVFDLNGYSLTLPSSGRPNPDDEWTCALFYFKHGTAVDAKLTITDTSDSQTGKVLLGNNSDFVGYPNYFNFSGTKSVAIKISGGTFAVCSGVSSSKLKYANLILSGVNSTVITGGKFLVDSNNSMNPTSCVDTDNYTVTTEGGYYVVSKSYKFYVGADGFDTFDDARAHLTAENKTIKLGKDIVDEKISVPSTANVTIDMNGHNIGRSIADGNGEVLLVQAATVELINSSASTATIDNTNAFTVKVVGAANLTINSDNITVKNSSSGSTKALFTAQQATNTITLKNGYFEGKLAYNSNCKISVTGGSFSEDPNGLFDPELYHAYKRFSFDNYNVAPHSYDATTYTWAENGSSCTATHTCTTKNCTHAETATATITSAEKTPATCTVKGTTTYTATFTEDWTATQTKDVQDIDVIAHTYGTVTYTWAKDRSACTAEHSCTCGDKQTANATISSEVTTPSACQTAGNRTYTATFSETWAATQTDTVNGSESALGHEWGDPSYSWSGASCTATRCCTRTGCTTCETETVNGTYVKDTDANCTVCEKGHYAASFENTAFEAQTTAANSVDNGNALGHSYGDAVFTWAENGKTASAKITCTRNGCNHFEEDNAAVSSVTDTPASCTAKGTTLYTAVITLNDTKYTDTKTVEDINALGHSFTNYVSDNNASCIVDGTKTAQCDRCDATDTVADAGSKLGHDIVKDPAVAATSFSTGLTEGEHCTRCDYKIAQQVVEMLPAPQDENKAEVAVTVEEDATEVKSDIPAAAFAQKTEGEETKPVTIKAEGFAEITFDSAAANAIAGNAGSKPVSLSVEKATVETKQAAITEAGIQDVVSVVLSFSLKAEGADVFSGSNAAGKAEVSVPFTPSNANAVILVYYINGTEKTLVPATYVDGKLTITLEHFSDYVVCEHTAHKFVDHICSECGTADEHLKFYFGVTSGNTIDAVVGDDYNLVVRLPEDGIVNTSSATITAKMQNVASLGVNGTKQHSITVNTGLGSSNVDLKTWLSNAYDFEDGKINANINGNEVTYDFARSNYKIYGRTDTEAARAAWQSLTSHVSTATQADDDSFITIANGSFIMMGTEYLCFEDNFSGDLVLDNFSNLDAMNTNVRNAVCLKTVANQRGKITMVVKAGTQLAVGQTIATLDDDYIITIEGDPNEISALNGTLTAIRDANGKTEMIKKMIDAFNDIIYVVDACEEVNVTMHAHEFTDGVCSCGELKENVKFYFGVTSGNTIDAVVGDDYNLVVRLPEDGIVNTSSATITAKMQNVASLGVNGTKQHSITVNTGLGSSNVDLKTWLSNAYGFGNGKINATIDGNKVTYNFARTGNKITGTTDTEAARAAWQALTSHVSTAAQADDDSFIAIANGSFIAMGTEYLRFEDDFTADALVLDNFSNLDAMNTTVRNAVYLDSCENQRGKITMVVKAGTQLAVGQTIATLDDDYIITIEGDPNEISALNGTLTAIRDANGKTEMIKKMIDAFNDIIYVVNACEEVNVEMKVLETGEIEYIAEDPTYKGEGAQEMATELTENKAVKNYESGVVDATNGKASMMFVALDTVDVSVENKSSYIFEVKPIDVMGMVVSNDAILSGKMITFRLPVPATVDVGTQIKVTHRAQKTDDATDFGTYQVKSVEVEGNSYKYIELQASEFSFFGYELVEDEEYTAINTTTGIGYNTLTEALAAANSGETVKLLADISGEKFIVVENGRSLDLNGCDIDGATLLYVTGTIYDSAATTARGVVKTKGMMLGTVQLFTPVYDSANKGYSFYDLQISDKYENGLWFTLRRNDGERNAAYTLLKANEDYCATFKASVVLTWTTVDEKSGEGISVKQDFSYNDTFMRNAVDSALQSTGGTIKWFTCAVTGIEGTAIMQPKYTAYDSLGNELFSIYGAQYQTQDGGTTWSKID